MTPRTPALDRLLGNVAGRRPGRLAHWHGRGQYEGSAPPSAKLVIVDVIAEHDIEAHEQLAGESNAGLRPASAVHDGEVAAPQIVVGAGRQRSGLAEHPSQKGVALLWGLCGVLFVVGGVNR